MTEVNTKDWKHTIELEQFLRHEESLQRRLEIQEMVEAAVVKEIDVDDAYESIQADVEAMARALPFIDQKCIFRISERDVVLVYAASGSGKSTLSGEITMSYMHHPKPVLYISNEESSSEVLKRLAYFHLGWNPNIEYTNPGQPEILRAALELLRGKVHVCAKDMVESSLTPTQTAEGVHRILDSAIGKYSAVIIDYYQAIDTTIRNPKAPQHEAQLAFDSRLDLYRKTIKCPIFIMAQSIPMQSGSIRADFQNNRQKGNTKVFDKATVVIEIQSLGRKKSKNSESVELRTELQENLNQQGSPSITLFYLHKDRWRGKARSALAFQFVRGRYVYLRDLTKEQMEMLE